MPTNQNGYNSRVTDEALEKRFRDTFTSQGGAELVSDLYASGVIVPVVDFTSAAEGSTLRSDLQTAWDFATQIQTVKGQLKVLTSVPGFYKVGVILDLGDSGPTANTKCTINISDGSTFKNVWQWSENTSVAINQTVTTPDFVVFLRSGDSLRALSDATDHVMSVWYRQIADVSGNLTDPLGFTSS